MEKLSCYYAKEDGVLAEYLDHISESSIVEGKTAYNYYMILRSLAKSIYHSRHHMECEPDEVILSHVSLADMASITAEEWEQYLIYQEMDKTEKEGSLAVRLSVIHGFYRWLLEQKPDVDVSFIFATKRPHKYETAITKTISEADEEFLCKQMQGPYYPSEPKKNCARNICIVRLISRCGIGLQELHDIDLYDINVRAPQNPDQRGSISLRNSHGDVVREVLLDEVTSEAIDKYLCERVPPIDGDNAFLTSCTGSRLSRGAIQKVLRKAVAGSRLWDISVRNLQLTAKKRMIKEYGANAGERLNITSPRYCKQLLHKYSELTSSARV